MEPFRLFRPCIRLRRSKSAFGGTAAAPASESLDPLVPVASPETTSPALSVGPVPASRIGEIAVRCDLKRSAGGGPGMGRPVEITRSKLLAAELPRRTARPSGRTDMRPAGVAEAGVKPSCNDR